MNFKIFVLIAFVVLCLLSVAGAEEVMDKLFSKKEDSGESGEGNPPSKKNIDDIKAKYGGASKEKAKARAAELSAKDADSQGSNGDGSSGDGDGDGVDMDAETDPETEAEADAEADNQ